MTTTEKSPVCEKCGETLQSLMFFALAKHFGARSSFDPVACKHKFRDVGPAAQDTPQ